MGERQRFDLMASGGAQRHRLRGGKPEIEDVLSAYRASKDRGAISDIVVKYLITPCRAGGCFNPLVLTGRESARLKLAADIVILGQRKIELSIAIQIFNEDA